MSTFMANKANIERKWYILDAAGKPLGKTARYLCWEMADRGTGPI